MIALSISPFLFVDDNHTCSIIDAINKFSTYNHESIIQNMFLFALAPPHCVYEMNVLGCTTQPLMVIYVAQKGYKCETRIYETTITHRLKHFQATKITT